MSLIQYDPKARKIGASNRREKVVEAVQAGVTGMALADLSFGLPGSRRVTGQWTEGRVEDKTRRTVLSADDDDGESGNGSDSGAGENS